MVVAVEADEEVAPGVGPRQAEHELAGLGPREEEAHLLGRGEVLDDLLGEGDLLGVPPRGVEVGQAVELLGHRVEDDLVAVAHGARTEAAHVVEVLVAVGVPEVGALPPGDPDRLEQLVAGQVAVGTGHQLEGPLARTRSTSPSTSCDSLPSGYAGVLAGDRVPGARRDPGRLALLTVDR